MQIPITPVIRLGTVQRPTATARGPQQKSTILEPRGGELPQGDAAAAIGIQLGCWQESRTQVWERESIESRVQAAAAFDSSVPTEAQCMVRNMSTPSAGGCGPTKKAIALDKSHRFQFRQILSDVALELVA